MAYHLLDGGAGGLEVLAGVEVGGILVKILADSAGHRKAQVAVDVDLANGHACGFAEHILRNADRIGHIAAVLVDHFDKLRYNGTCAVQNDREAGQQTLDLFKDVESELRLGAGLELIRAVAGADSDGKAVNAGALNKLLYLLGVGITRVLRGNVDVVLNALEPAEFALDYNVVIVRVFNDLAGECDIVFKRMMRAVDHNGGKAAVDAAFAQFKGVAVVKMHTDRKIGLDDRGFDQFHKIGVVGVLPCARADLKDQWCVFFLCGLGDALDDFHIVYVERTDGVAAFIGLFEHFCTGNEWHRILLLKTYSDKRSGRTRFASYIINQPVN